MNTLRALLNVDNYYVNNDIKGRYHCHKTGNSRGSVHRYCSISLKLNHKIPVVFHNLKNIDSHLILKFSTVCFYCTPSWGLSKYIETKLHTTCLYLISTFPKN